MKFVSCQKFESRVGCSMHHRAMFEHESTEGDENEYENVFIIFIFSYYVIKYQVFVTVLCIL